MEKDEPEFMSIKNLGEKPLTETIDKIHSLGLKMKWEKDEVETEHKENPQENITIESNQDISESNDENKANDVYIDKLSDEELDKFIEDMNAKQEENKRKLERLEKLKRAKELIELNKQQDKEIEKLESQIREKGRNTDE